MRTNLLKTHKLILGQDEDCLHSVPVAQMGNYQEHLKMMPSPLREIDPAQPKRLHTFGNPFKQDKKGTMIEEADEFVAGPRNKVKHPGEPNTPASLKRRRSVSPLLLRRPQSPPVIANHVGGRDLPLLQGPPPAPAPKPRQPTKKELPPFYSPWMEIANQLSYLIENHQLRSHVDKMPLLSTQHLRGHRELALAHMALSFITMGYVWQEGENGTVKVLPRNVAIPFGEISQALGLPPILVHMDFVLVNWKKKNPYGPLEIENLEPIICSPGGESTRAFILVTFLVEKAAAPGIQAVAQAVNSILQSDNRILEEALQELAKALKDMMAMLKKMHAYVDPDIFYAVTRLFFSGWKENPALPGGLTYAGVCEEPLEYSGASAAQSTTLQAFDEFLGIRHSRESSAFLCGMREYMPPHHRAFIEEIQSAPPLRRHVLSSGSEELCEVYNGCVAALVDLRTYHVALVTKFITIAGTRARAKNGKPTLSRSPASFLEGRGTGGSPSGALSFLKNVRDTTKEALLSF